MPEAAARPDGGKLHRLGDVTLRYRAATTAATRRLVVRKGTERSCTSAGAIHPASLAPEDSHEDASLEGIATEEIRSRPDAGYLWSHRRQAPLRRMTRGEGVGAGYHDCGPGIRIEREVR